MSILKILKINYVDWTYRGRENHTEHYDLIQALNDIQFDICVIERVSKIWADLFIDICDDDSLDSYFISTANIDLRLAYTAGSLIISKTNNLINDPGKIQLPSSKPQSDAGNPSYIPKFNIGNHEILFGQMPQNIARDESAETIQNYTEFLTPTFSGANESDILLIGVYNSRFKEYEVHSWQILAKDAKNDDLFVFDYVKNNYAIAIIETLNYWHPKKSSISPEITNFITQEIYTETNRDPVMGVTDCVGIDIVSYPLDINTPKWPNQDCSVVRMFEISGILK